MSAGVTSAPDAAPVPVAGRRAAARGGEQREREKQQKRPQTWYGYAQRPYSSRSAAPHQPFDQVTLQSAPQAQRRRLPYRQLDAERGAELAQDGRGRQPLDRLPISTAPRPASRPRDQLARAAVAAVAAQHGDDQVAHAGEAGERLGPRAARLAEPRHLGEAARDQRRLGVVAEAEPVDAAGRERDHVLRSRAELHADQVAD